MAPKKKVEKLSLGDFMNAGGGSWADEVEDLVGTQPLPSVDRADRPWERRTGGSNSYGGGDRGGDRGDRLGGYYTLRDNLPTVLPDKPPFTAHLGNLSYNATQESVSDFFSGCNVVNVRIIEDRIEQRPKGFAYAEFGDLEGLKQALTLDGQQFEGRGIRIKIADPPKDREGGRGDGLRELSVWERKGPPADLPRPNRSGPDFGERRPPREQGPADDGKVRDFSNWERRGPLSPLPQPEAPPMSREGSKPRTHDGGQDFRNNRRTSPAAWGPGEGRPEGRSDGSRPPRREFVDRPERVASAAEKDMQWRSNMRPDGPAKTPGQSREGSEAPSSPAISSAAPAGRPKLNLSKRTVADSPDATSPALTASGESKPSPFGAARPIDTAAKEREIEQKRLQALKEKKEADEKAKEDRRLAKEAAAAKEAAEEEAAAEEAAAKEAAAKEAAAKEAAEKAAAEAQVGANGEAKAGESPEEEGQAVRATTEAPEVTEAAPPAPSDTQAASSAAAPSAEPEGRGRPPREPYKSRATESGNWRTGEGRGGARGGGSAPTGPRRGGGTGRGSRGDRGDRNDRHDDRRSFNRQNGNSQGAAPQTQGNQPTSDDRPTSASSPAIPDEDGWTTVNKTRGGRGSRQFA